MRFDTLQYFRGIAALFVVFFHAGGVIGNKTVFGREIFDQIFSFGSSGVEFFFVLSGFIIHHVHRRDFNNYRNIKPFIIRRMIRVYPIYIFLALSVLFAKYLQSYISEGYQFVFDIKEIIFSLMLLPENKINSIGTGSSILSVAWTLQYEVFFYLCFAISLIRKELGVVAIVLFLIVNLFFNYEAYYPAYFIFSDYIYLFIFGVATSVLSQREFLCKSNNALLLALGSCGWIICAILDFNATDGLYSNIRSLVYGFLSVIIILAGTNLERTRGCWNQKALLWVGNASYSLYLIHFPLIVILMKVFVIFFGNEMSNIYIILLLLISIIIILYVSVFIHKYIEKPMCKFFTTKFVN
ncbi:acyltransferase family protein [Vibrio cortegadensis]|uniref:acyltransferase family protein n=1 Tax=Vibrio cortegadensis TaxID=1328770 RepID=UPI00352CFFAC